MAFGGAYALASIDWCGDWPTVEPTLLHRGAEAGVLEAGAARVDIVPPRSVVVAGYGPPRVNSESVERPLRARAVVLRNQGAMVALVSVDLLTLPAELEGQISRLLAEPRISDLWMVATHAHSSMGGYDSRLLSELAGTGAYRPAAARAVADAAVEAIRGAMAHLAPATVEWGSGSFPALVDSRDGTPEPDARLTRLVLRSPGARIAELLVFAAHPTLEPRRSAVLSPDYPGLVSEIREEAHGGVCLVLQGGIGNTIVRLADPPPPRPWEKFSRDLSQAADSVVLVPTDGRLAYAQAKVSLPRPDSRRLAPRFFRAAGDNFLCASAAREAEVSALQVGNLRLVSFPGEVTSSAARALESATGATRAISLANGYLGYADIPERVRAAVGESRRQYFPDQLLEVLTRASQVAVRGLDTPVPAQ